MLAQRMLAFSHPSVSKSLGRALPTAACQSKKPAQVKDYSALPLIVFVNEQPCVFSQEYTQVCLPKCEKHLHKSYSSLEWEQE